jgi:hypothetical protein
MKSRRLLISDFVSTRAAAVRELIRRGLASADED